MTTPKEHSLPEKQGPTFWECLAPWRMPCSLEYPLSPWNVLQHVFFKKILGQSGRDLMPCGNLGASPRIISWSRAAWEV